MEKKTSKRVSEFFLNVLSKLLEEERSESVKDIHCERLRGHVNKADDDVKTYVRKYCKGDSLFEFFKLRKNYFMVDARTKSVRPTPGAFFNAARSNVTSSSSLDRNSGRGGDQLQTPFGANRWRSISVSSQPFTGNGAIGDNNNHYHNGTRSSSSSSTSSLSTGEVESLTIDHFVKEIFESPDCKLYFSGIHFVLLPRRIKTYLQKTYPGSQKLRLFFLNHSKYFTVDSEGFVTLNEDGNFGVDDVGGDKSSSINITRNDCSRGESITNEEALREARAIEYYVDILESRQAQATPLKKLVGHLSQAPEEVISYMKANYKNANFKKFFTNRQKIFYVCGENVSLSGKYQPALKETLLSSGLCLPDSGTTTNGIDGEESNMKCGSIWSLSSDEGDVVKSRSDARKGGAASKKSDASKSRTEPGDCGDSPAISLRPNGGTEQTKISRVQKRKSPPVATPSSRSGEETTTENKIINRDPSNDDESPTTVSKEREEVSEGLEKKKDGPEIPQLSLSHPTNDDATVISEPESRAEAEKLEECSPTDSEGTKVESTQTEESSDTVTDEDIEFAIAETLWLMEMFCLEQIELKTLYEEMDEYSVAVITDILEKQPGSHSMYLSDLEAEFAAKRRCSEMPKGAKEKSLGNFLKNRKDFHVVNGVVSLKRGREAAIPRRSEFKVFSTERKSILKELYYTDTYNDRYWLLYTMLKLFSQTLNKSQAKARRDSDILGCFSSKLNVMCSDKAVAQMSIDCFYKKLQPILSRLVNHLPKYFELMIDAAEKNFFAGCFLKNVGRADEARDILTRSVTCSVVRSVSRQVVQKLISDYEYLSEPEEHQRSWWRNVVLNRDPQTKLSASCAREIKSILLDRLTGQYNSFITFTALPGLLALAKRFDVLRDFRPIALLNILESHGVFTIKRAGVYLNVPHLSQMAMVGSSKALNTVGGFFGEHMRGKTFLIDTKVNCDVVKKIVSSYPEDSIVKDAIICVYGGAEELGSSYEIRGDEKNEKYQSSNSPSETSEEAEPGYFTSDGVVGEKKSPEEEEDPLGHVEEQGSHDGNQSTKENVETKHDDQIPTALGVADGSNTSSKEVHSSPEVGVKDGGRFGRICARFSGLLGERAKCDGTTSSSQPRLGFLRRESAPGQVIIDRENETADIECAMKYFPNSYSRFVCVDPKLADAVEDGGEESDPETDPQIEACCIPDTDVGETTARGFVDSEEKIANTEGLVTGMNCLSLDDNEPERSSPDRGYNQNIEEELTTDSTSFPNILEPSESASRVFTTEDSSQLVESGTDAIFSPEVASPGSRDDRGAGGSKTGSDDGRSPEFEDGPSAKNVRFSVADDSLSPRSNAASCAYFEDARSVSDDDYCSADEILATAREERCLDGTIGYLEVLENQDTQNFDLFIKSDKTFPNKFIEEQLGQLGDNEILCVGPEDTLFVCQLLDEKEQELGSEETAPRASTPHAEAKFDEHSPPAGGTSIVNASVPGHHEQSTDDDDDDDERITSPTVPELEKTDTKTEMINFSNNCDNDVGNTKPEMGNKRLNLSIVDPDSSNMLAGHGGEISVAVSQPEGKQDNARAEKSSPSERPVVSSASVVETSVEFNSRKFSRLPEDNPIAAEIRKRTIQRYERRKKILLHGRDTTTTNDDVSDGASSSSIPTSATPIWDLYSGRIVLFADRMCLVDVSDGYGHKHTIYCRSDLYNCPRHGTDCSQDFASLRIGDDVDCKVFRDPERDGHVLIATSFCRRDCRASGSSGRLAACDSSSWWRLRVAGDENRGGARPKSAELERCGTTASSVGTQVEMRAGNTADAASQTISTGSIYQQNVFLEDA